MKTAILYYSNHHGNTKKLLDAIAASDEGVVLIDATKKQEVNLPPYDRIGIASGIYYGSFAKPLLTSVGINVPAKKPVFFIATCGAPRKGYFDAVKDITDRKQCDVLGEYMCLGYDTYGPLKLVGGIAKGHPTEEEIRGAVEFYQNLYVKIIRDN